MSKLFTAPQIREAADRLWATWANQGLVPSDPSGAYGRELAKLMIEQYGLQQDNKKRRASGPYRTRK